MNKYVSFNQTLVPAEKARISAAASGALYGKSVFTSVAIDDGKPFLWAKHWRRLKNNAEKLNIDLSSFDETTVKNALDETIVAGEITKARARITFFDEAASVIWNSASERQTSLLIMTADAHQPPKNFRLTVSPFQTNSASPLAGVKSGNYLEKIIAADEARTRGFNEAVRENERGEIASACLANIFWWKDEKLFTPSLATGCLPGTTREFVLENRECFEVESDLAGLSKADAIFLTSAGLGIVQVREFGGKLFDKSENIISPIQ